MPLRPIRRIHRLTHRAIATVVAVSLLAMPVTYRGGAEAAHAHTIFQFWEDVRSGSLTHHPAEPGDVESSPPSVGDQWHAEPLAMDADGERAPVCRGVGGHRPDAGAATSDRATDTNHADIGSRELVKCSPSGMTATVRELGEDATVVSSAFTPNVRGTALVLFHPAGLPLFESYVSPARASLTLDGITDAPTAPPPRQAA